MSEMGWWQGASTTSTATVPPISLREMMKLAQEHERARPPAALLMRPAVARALRDATVKVSAVPACGLLAYAGTPLWVACTTKELFQNATHLARLARRQGQRVWLCLEEGDLEGDRIAAWTNSSLWIAKLRDWAIIPTPTKSPETADEMTGLRPTR